jgi:FAD/FMN-containing dehydrogenase
MMLQPSSREDLAALLSAASQRSERIDGVDLSRIARLLDHQVEDMTARVEGGMKLADFQEQLRQRGQWLPVDPPAPDRLTVAELLATDASGPRRFGWGTIRDHVIGLTVALADGRLIRSGGNVVKNVAGYDLMKLFIGGQGSLGVILEVTFKLRPVPESEKFVQADCASVSQADKLAEAVLDSELTPTVLDLHNQSAAGGPMALVLGFAGTVEEVDWQLATAASLGFTQPASLDYDHRFRAANGCLSKESVLPSRMAETIARLDGAGFVARFGNGIVYHDASAQVPASNSTQAIRGGPNGPGAALTQRLKDEFDPKRILSEPPL